MNLISTDEAAELLGVSGRRVRQLIDEGKLPAQYVGGGYVIDKAVLETVKVYGKPGRPPKAKHDQHGTKQRSKVVAANEPTLKSAGEKKRRRK